MTRARPGLAIMLAVLLMGGTAAAQSARESYGAALIQERTLWKAVSERAATLPDFRAVIARYEAIVRKYPRSSYSDNALWQGAGIAHEVFNHYGEERDRRTAQRLLRMLLQEYPASSLVPRAMSRLALLDKPIMPAKAAPASPPSNATAGASSALQPTGAATLRQIRRLVLPTAVRIMLEFDTKVTYLEHRLANPDRLFFDFPATQAAPALVDASLSFDDGPVRFIRVGRHPNQTTRVVFDVAEVARYSVLELPNPYRIVVDCETAPSGARATPNGRTGPAVPASVVAEPTPVLPAAHPLEGSGALGPLAAPRVPARNFDGAYSLARQLGLGVSRIVIDPGHGGHDPGAKAPRLTEAQLVLDIALRLEKVLLKQAGTEVVLTRRTDVYVPLEDRMDVANREEADLFLSIHANANRNPKMRGIETYFLNFAASAEAAEVAARENSNSGRAMSHLPDIVKAIALNSKLDESRDLASMVQRALVRRLRPANKELRDLGVKQAPFVVLIGAGMPSALVEVSFLTNPTEARLLRTPAYRQRVAQALGEAILRYQRSLGAVQTTAQQ